MNKVSSLRKGILNPASFARKAGTVAGVMGATVGASMAALPTEYDLAGAGTTLAGYVATAAGLGLAVFIAFRAAHIIPAAFKKLLH